MTRFIAIDHMTTKSSNGVASHGLPLAGLTQPSSLKNLKCILQ